MGLRPLHPCAEPGCPVLVSRGRCEAHTREQGSFRRAHSPKVRGARGGEIDFYQSKLWKVLRLQVFYEEPLCRTLGCKRLTEHIDHIIPRERGGSDDRSNLQGLCASCHSRKTRLEQMGAKR